jgi:hypothetical protein
MTAEPAAVSRWEQLLDEITAIGLPDPRTGNRLYTVRVRRAEGRLHVAKREFDGYPTDLPRCAELTVADRRCAPDIRTFAELAAQPLCLCCLPMITAGTANLSPLAEVVVKVAAGWRLLPPDACAADGTGSPGRSAQWGSAQWGSTQWKPDRWEKLGADERWSCVVRAAARAALGPAPHASVVLARPLAAAGARLRTAAARAARTEAARRRLLRTAVARADVVGRDDEVLFAFTGRWNSVSVEEIVDAFGVRTTDQAAVLRCPRVVAAHLDQHLRPANRRPRTMATAGLPPDLLEIVTGLWEPDGTGPLTELTGCLTAARLL